MSTLKVTEGIYFLTITLDNKKQRIHNMDLAKRVFLVLKDMGKVINPFLKDFSDKYEGVIEISEALSYDGRYFPRLHFHYIIDVTCPITCLLTMGKYVQLGYGYNLFKLNDKTLKEKLVYKDKQQGLWDIFMDKHPQCRIIYDKYRKWSKGIALKKNTLEKSSSVTEAFSEECFSLLNSHK